MLWFGLKRRIEASEARLWQQLSKLEGRIRVMEACLQEGSQNTGKNVKEFKMRLERNDERIKELEKTFKEIQAHAQELEEEIKKCTKTKASRRTSTRSRKT